MGIIDLRNEFEGRLIEVQCSHGDCSEARERRNGDAGGGYLVLLQVTRATMCRGDAWVRYFICRECVIQDNRSSGCRSGLFGMTYSVLTNEDTHAHLYCRYKSDRAVKSSKLVS
jgi:hypothetical protein